MIKRIKTPTSHFVISEPVVKDLARLRGRDHGIHPKNENNKKASPEWEILPKMCLELCNK